MKLILSGVPPWDGEYEFDSFADGTNREYHRVKEICGVRAGELVEALSAGDSGAWVAWTAVVLARHGMQVDLDDLWNAPEDAIKWKADSQDVADPPTTPAEGSGPNETESSSGDVSETGGD